MFNLQGKFILITLNKNSPLNKIKSSALKLYLKKLYHINLIKSCINKNLSKKSSFSS